MSDKKETSLLVVEDSAVVTAVYGRFLKQMGLHDVDYVGSGSEALSMLGRRSYAAIMSDWHMLGGSGIELLRAVRADPAHRTTAFVMATVESRPDRVALARRAGADQYLIKPFHCGALRDALVAASRDLAAAMAPPVRATRSVAASTVEFYAWPDACASTIAVRAAREEHSLVRLDAPRPYASDVSATGRRRA